MNQTLRDLIKGMGAGDTETTPLGRRGILDSQVVAHQNNTRFLRQIRAAGADNNQRIPFMHAFMHALAPISRGITR